MDSAARSQHLDGPYKAAQSYGPADTEIFFGRNVDGDQLTQFFKDRQLSVLTAPSGIGKSSLLQAYVIPQLERERWTAVWARPEQDPEQALREAVQRYLIPDPAREADVVAGLRAAMPESGTPTLGEALAWFEALSPAERTSRRLFVPANLEPTASIPMVSRALRRTLSCGDLIEHFEAIVAHGSPIGLTPDTPLEALEQALRREATLGEWREWQAGSEQGEGLLGTLQFWQQTWMPLKPSLAGIFLVVDQFEEMFTRLSPAKLQRFLDCLEELRARAAGDIPAPFWRPVHVALSLRKDFFADLAPHLRRFAMERATFFLGPFDDVHARSAAAQPAALYGLEFTTEAIETPSCLDAFLELVADNGLSAESAWSGEPDAVDMPGEHRRYQPALVSLAGAYLWKALQRHPRAPDAGPLSRAEFQALLPGLDEVFSAYLAEALDEVDRRGQGHDINRYDALELLDRLGTSSGYRNIVLEAELVEQSPLRGPAVRVLLDVLDHELHLIRRYPERGRLVVEVTHEQLIRPARDQLNVLRLEDFHRASLQGAQDMLRMVPDEPDAARADPLPSPFREALIQYLHRLDLGLVERKTLLRSLLYAGPQGGPARWSRAVVELVNAPAAVDRGQRPLLSGAELDVALRDVALGGAAPSAGDPQFLVRSALSDRSGDASARIGAALAIVEPSVRHRESAV